MQDIFTCYSDSPKIKNVVQAGSQVHRLSPGTLFSIEVLSKKPVNFILLARNAVIFLELLRRICAVHSYGYIYPGGRKNR